MNQQRLEAIAAKHRVRLILQFGSTVSGKVHPRSDVDLAVLLEKPELSLEDYSDLLHELQTLFPGREVDLAILNRADPLLLKQVADGCRRLYGTDEEFQRFRLLAFKRYQDHRRYLDLERTFVARTLDGVFPPR